MASKSLSASPVPPRSASRGTRSLVERLFAGPIERIVRQRLGAAWVENDATFTQASRGWKLSERDRYDADREEILKEALDAWRLNPLARRIVGLTTQYVVGGGLSIGCKHEETHRFLQAFWNDRLNRMTVRVYELCDELSRTGNLFILLSTDPAGMSYIRTVPATDIEKIDHRENDIEQPTRFWIKDANLPSAFQGEGSGMKADSYPAYDEEADGVSPDGAFAPVMIHYTINRPTGAQWGESDLAPILKWISRYANWLEDRARLNRFRNAFLFILKGRFASETERAARQATLAASPPQPGSVMVADESETWEVISPRLESQDANTDGLALKKMIASGSGIPLHFLAEPESATRTTAEAAGGPTFRHFEQRQNTFVWIVKDILRIAILRRARVDHRMSVRAEVQVRGADISSRDNVALSMAAQNIVNMLSDLRDRNLIPNDEYLRMAYRFAGEVVDVENMIAAAQREGFPVKAGDSLAPSPSGEGRAGAAASTPPKKRKANRPLGGSAKIDPDSGEPKPLFDLAPLTPPG